jgi:hypothetical protein
MDHAPFRLVLVSCFLLPALNEPAARSKPLLPDRDAGRAAIEDNSYPYYSTKDIHGTPWGQALHLKTSEKSVAKTAEITG